MQANPLEKDNTVFFDGCTYTVTMISKESSTVAIPCDFPVKSNSGDDEKDLEEYILAFTQWNDKNMDKIQSFLFSPGSTGVESVVIEIPQAEFDNFSEGKKNSVLSASSVYSIIQ